MTSTVSRLSQSPFLAQRRLKPQRWAVATSCAIAGGAHIPVIAPHLAQAPYMGLLFIALTVSCLTLAAIVLLRDSTAVYGAVAAICGLALIGYAATRLIAFPMLADDVGNWLEPLGVLAITAEALTVTLAISALPRPHTTTGRPTHST